MIRMKSLEKMVQAEVAADKWWDGLSDKEKKAYLKAHPNSKYGSNGGINGTTSGHMLDESRMRMLQLHHENMHRMNAGSAKGGAHKRAAELYQNARRSYNKAAISNVNGAGRDVVAKHLATARKHRSAADAHSRQNGIYATSESK